MVHTILERFVDETELPPRGAPWEPRHRELLFNVADEEFLKVEARGVTGRRLLWEAAKAEILQDLETFLEKDAEWRSERNMQPLQVEWGFGIESEPVSLTLPDGSTVKFRGLIDRVDADEEKRRVLVVDYKTGSVFPYRDMEDDPLGHGTHLQLPVYALAAGTALVPGATVEAEYWFISSKGRFERKTVPLAQVEREFQTTVQSIVSGIRMGVFPANPGPAGMGGPTNCTYCDFNRLCPANRQALWGKKQNSTEAEPYVDLLRGSGEDGDSRGDS